MIRFAVCAMVMLLASCRSPIGSKANLENTVTTEPQEEKPSSIAEEIRFTTGKWPLNTFQTKPAKIEFEGATRFTFNGVRCRLLGVRESADPATQEKAKAFAEKWLESIGAYVVIDNSDRPIVTEDGTCVVWIYGCDAYSSCLNEELVRIGSVEADTNSWGTYTFNILTKQGEMDSQWRKQLVDAKESHSRGGKPRVLFDWP